MNFRKDLKMRERILRDGFGQKREVLSTVGFQGGASGKESTYQWEKSETWV